MLSHVTHKQDAVLFSQPLQEVIDLTGTGETRFIQHVEMLLSGISLRYTGKVVLNVFDKIPASPSLYAAREVGAKPSTL